MFRNIAIIIILVFPMEVSGQMFPLWDQFLNNTLAINPAYAGSEDALSTSLLYRKQWVGFEGAPENMVMSAHAPLKNNRMGLGIVILNGSYGINREASIIGNYAYRSELGKGILSLGLGFGVTRYNVAWNDLILSDPGDTRFTSAPQTALLPDFSLGAYYYTDKYFAGISAPLFLSHEPDKGSGHYVLRNDFSEYNYFLEGGYYFTLGDRMKLLPSALLKYHPGNEFQADVNVHLIVNNSVWLGVGYRNSNTVVGMVQLKLNRQIRISYAYDFDAGKTGSSTGGSHEVVLSYLFSFSRIIPGPRQF